MILEDNLKNADEPAASTHSAPHSSVRPFKAAFSYKFNSLIFGWIFCHVDVVIFHKSVKQAYMGVRHLKIKVKLD